MRVAVLQKQFGIGFHHLRRQRAQVTMQYFHAPTLDIIRRENGYDERRRLELMRVQIMRQGGFQLAQRLIVRACASFQPFDTAQGKPDN